MEQGSWKVHNELDNHAIALKGDGRCSDKRANDLVIQTKPIEDSIAALLLNNEWLHNYVYKLKILYLLHQRTNCTEQWLRLLTMRINFTIYLFKILFDDQALYRSTKYMSYFSLVSSVSIREN